MVASHLTITLFGEFSLTPNDKLPVGFAGDRPISLLAYLLLHRRTAVSRQHLAFTLWPDSSDSQARANLRNLLFTLRQTLPQADSYLVSDSMTLWWRPEADFSLDVADFEDALAAAGTAASPADRVFYLETAIGLYKGDLLPNNYDDWIIPLREELRQNYLDALHQLVNLLEQQQEYRPAARYAQRLLQQDPLDETAYILLMRLHAQSGDRAGVRRVYETCVATLRRELGVEPSPATRSAYEQLLRLEASARDGDVSLPQPPTPVLAPRPLPTWTTPFIGREAELARIAEMLADPSCRLLTIVGMGGIGKTRLALQTAIGHQRVFSDGVAFVPLEAVNETIRVISATAAALNLTFSGQADPQEQLFNYLSHKEMLLVLDNVEGFLDDIDLLAELLKTTTSIVLVVTSRERLNLRGEWLFPLEGLPIPENVNWAAPETINENPVVRLFVQSARRLLPEFVPDMDDLKAICRLGELVNGMPLALELAASWVRLLSCAEIADELEQGIDILAASHRDVLPRHQSIRAVFDYSWDLLAADEQRTLAQLSVFHGGFTREGAQQVTGATLPLLASLVDKSLVRPAIAGRHMMHDLVRQYAADQLAAQPELRQATILRHSNYFLGLLVEQEAALCSPRQKELLFNLTAGISNILRAWQWAAQQHNLAQLRAASWPFWYYFELRGMFRVGEFAFRQAEEALKVALVQQERPPADLLVALANVQTHRAYFSFRCGNTTEATQTLEKVIAVLRQNEDEDALCDALLLQASVHWFSGQIAEAAEVTREALDISHRSQRPWQISVHTAALGVMLHELGDYDQAYELLSEALAQAQALGDPRAISYATSYLGRTTQTLGRTAETAALQLDGLRLATEMNDRFGMALAWEQLAKGALANGNYDEACRSFDESIALFRVMGDEQSLARMLNQLGDARAQAGEPGLAEGHFREALALAAASENWLMAFQALSGLAQLFANQGKDSLAWGLATILGQQPVPLGIEAQAEALKQAIQPNLAPDQRAAIEAWIGERPLSSLIQDISEDKLPV